MNDLPDLPLEKILGCLSLEERLKARAVSRKLRDMIDSFRPKMLFFSNYPTGFIHEKRRLFGDPFVRDLYFISSPRFESFFDPFSSSILSSLKHLRLCDLYLHAASRKILSRTLNSFAQLEELGLFRFNLLDDSEEKIEIELNLPMLNSIHVEGLYAIKTLTLDAPRLRKVKSLSPLEIVRADTVEKLITNKMAWVKVMEFKNLKYLYVQNFLSIDPTFLSDLKQLEEVHLFNRHNALPLFDQKRQYARADLKIFLFGLLLNGQDDPAIGSFDDFNKRTIACLADNASRVAEEIPLCYVLDYSSIECLPQGSETAFLAKFIDLCEILVTTPVHHVKRFLAILKGCVNIATLKFGAICGQLDYLFDQLADHCAVEWLFARPQDFQSLSQFQNLIHRLFSFDLSYSTHIDLIRRVLENPPPFLSVLSFRSSLKSVIVRIGRPRRFDISIVPIRLMRLIKPERKSTSVSDVNAAIQFIRPAEKREREAEASDQPTKSKSH